ncbi:hypothetical protein DRO66_05010 [Candidatus Bathyarchaeota archaeon]|nr:MAG: hypothetical protein DRO66_05010 [Candidatus Bathyarchaeota archaeon]
MGPLRKLDLSSQVASKLNEKNRVVLLGLTFLFFLMMSYVANTAFFNVFDALFQNQLLVFSMIFINNIIVASLILLGMTFYVDLVVLGFFKKEKYANVVLDHPRAFAGIFAFIVLFISIFRGIDFFLGQIVVKVLPTIFLVSAPMVILEGYGIYVTIQKTLSRAITMKSLVQIYGLFFIAALVEVGLINVLG